MARHTGSMRTTHSFADFSGLSEELYDRPDVTLKPDPNCPLSAWEMKALAKASSSQRDASERPLQFMPTITDLMHKWDDEIFNGARRHKYGPFARELGLA